MLTMMMMAAMYVMTEYITFSQLDDDDDDDDDDNDDDDESRMQK